MWLKNTIQSALRRRGIEFRKAPAGYIPLPVFDVAVQAVMGRLGRPLRFIQVGANDGVYSDPLRRYVESHQWSGVLIEPQPDIFERLKTNYSLHGARLIFENLAISNGGGSLVLYRVADVDISKSASMPRSVTITSTNPKVVAEQAGVSEKDLARLEVPSVTLNHVVEKNGFQDFDVLQIDVEGYDFQVLQTIDLCRYRPAIIQFEHGHLSVAETYAVGKFLADNRYALYFGGHENDSVAMSAEALFLLGATTAKMRAAWGDAGQSSGA
ncbi:MAG TPA: FkbM family methyltransferase, partial [Rhizomicrobium sp.]